MWRCNSNKLSFEARIVFYKQKNCPAYPYKSHRRFHLHNLRHISIPSSITFKAFPLSYSQFKTSRSTNMTDSSTRCSNTHRSSLRSGKRNCLNDRTLEPFSGSASRRPLMEKFKPPLPERLLPKDPHPNYRPLFMSESEPEPVFPYVNTTTVSPESRDPQTSRSPVGLSSGQGTLKNGAKCPHCSRGLVYAYNLSKHIEVSSIYTFQNMPPFTTFQWMLVNTNRYKTILNLESTQYTDWLVPLSIVYF